jgi:type I restriction enzyme, S subunit
LYDENGAIGQIRTTDISGDGTIDYSTVPMVRLDVEDYQSHILKPGDLLISRSGTTGIACVFDEQTVPMLPGAFLIRFRLKQSLHPEFVKEYFNSPIGRRHISRLAQGGVQSNLRGSALLNEKLPVPSVVDQERVINMFFRLRKELVNLHEHKAKSKEILRGLSNQALVGKQEITHV